MATFGNFVDNTTLKATELNDLLKPTSVIPILRQSNTLPLVASVNRLGLYQVVNKLVFFQMHALVDTGGAGTANNRIEVDLPVAAAANSVRVLGDGYIEDDNVEDVLRVAVVRVSTTRVAFLAQASTSLTTFVGQTNGPALTLAVGDSVGFSIVYEAA